MQKHKIKVSMRDENDLFELDACITYVMYRGCKSFVKMVQTDKNAKLELNEEMLFFLNVIHVENIRLRF